MVGVLVSSLTFAGALDERPAAKSGMAVVKSNQSYKVIYKSEEAADVKVEIFDAKNKVVFTETIKKSSGFARPYNFDGLADGEYTIRLDNGSNWITESFVHKTGHEEKLAQLIQLSNGKYLLTVAGAGDDELSVSISDDSGATIHSNKQIVSGNFAQVYDLTNLHGHFSMEVADKSGASKKFFK